MFLMTKKIKVFCVYTRNLKNIDTISIIENRIFINRYLLSSQFNSDKLYC